jgi:hypothetical protein
MPRNQNEAAAAGLPNLNAPKAGKFFSPLYVALFLLLYVFLPALVLSCFLLLRLGSPALVYRTSLAVLAGAAWYNRDKIGLSDGLCFLLIVIFSHVVSYLFFDFFHDALVYHQPAITRIAAGFNPVYDGYMNLGRAPDTWSDQATYFPKMTWYFAASVTAVFGDVQLGKACHLILFFSAVLFVWHHTRGDHVLRRLLWVAACLNPIAFLQFTGYLVDGALAFLSAMALFYANLYFGGKTLTRVSHVMGIIVLAMLFCIKTSGFVYGSIIVFCVCLHCFFAELRASGDSRIVRWKAGLERSVKLGSKLGVPLFLLVAVLCFSPYITNLLEHRHLFYPLIQTDVPANSNVSLALEKLAEDTYPDAHNRFTRLLFSIAAYPHFLLNAPAEIKNPFGAPRLEWMLYRSGGIAMAGGLGPLFFLLLLLSALYWLLLRGWKNGENAWLLFTLCLMLFIQPHAWNVRYAPFLWMLPFILCLSIPFKKECFLVVPILLAIINVTGITYVFAKGSWEDSRRIAGMLEPHRGQCVLLDKSVFQCDGFFDRFDIKQKFANPEQTVFQNISLSEYRRERYIAGRPVLGSNIAFEEDIPLLPNFPVVFAEERAEPWVKMSEGVVLYDPEEKATLLTMYSQSLPKGCWNASGKIKFYVRVRDRPEGDMEFALTASPRVDEKGNFVRQAMNVFVNNQQIGEWLWDRAKSSEKTITLPQKILEESYNDEMRLLTLMFYLTPDNPDVRQEFNLMFEKMGFRSR